MSHDPLLSGQLSAGTQPIEPRFLQDGPDGAQLDEEQPAALVLQPTDQRQQSDRILTLLQPTAGHGQTGASLVNAVLSQGSPDQYCGHQQAVAVVGQSFPADEAAVPAVLADPLGGDPLTPAEYDPQRYKFCASPEETSGQASFGAQALSAQTQALSAQTQPLGQSPRQAAIHKLRSLSMKQSQTSKSGHELLSHLTAGAQHESGARLDPVYDSRLAAADGSDQLHGQEQKGKGSELQPDASGNHAQQQQQAFAHTAQTDPVQAQMHQSNACVAVVAEDNNPALLLSPRRSTSVAKLRSQSLAKHLHGSLRGFAANPALGQQMISTDSQTGSDSQADVQPQTRPGAGATGSTDARHATGSHMDGLPQIRQEAPLLQSTDAVHMLSSEADPSSQANPGTDPYSEPQSDESTSSAKAQSKQPDHSQEGMPVDTADIPMMIPSVNDSTAIVSQQHQAQPLPLTRPQQEGLLHSSSTAVAALPAITPDLGRAQSRSEGCSPVSLNSSSQTSRQYSPDPDQLGMPTSPSSTDTAGHISIVRQQSCDSTVAVCISSSGAGAKLSLEVVSQPVQDPCGGKHLSLDRPDHTASQQPVLKLLRPSQAPLEDSVAVADDRAVGSAAHGVSVSFPKMGSSPVRSDQAKRMCEEDPREAPGAVRRMPQPSSSAQHSHAHVDLVPTGNEDGKAPVQSVQQSDASDGCACIIEGDDGQGQGAVPESPGRKNGPGQSLLGRLEGGIRNLLGRIPKQQVRHSILPSKHSWA